MAQQVLSPNHLSYGELFAGVGGMSLGIELADWTCAWQVEKWEPAHQVLAHNWPVTERHRDVRDVSGMTLEPVTMVAFGSPCQSLSQGGQRNGLDDDDKSGLIREAFRIISEMRMATANKFPRWALWENVAGSMNSNDGADFQTVIDNFVALGATRIEWATVDAQHFGVPQKRRRVFMAACFDQADADAATEPIFPLVKSKRPVTEGKWGHSGIVHIVRLTDDHTATRIEQWHTEQRPVDEAFDQISLDRVLDDDNDFDPDLILSPQAATGILHRNRKSKKPCNELLGFTLSAIGNETETPTSQRRIPTQAVLENQRGEVNLSDYTGSLTRKGGKPGQGYQAVLKRRSDKSMIVRRLSTVEANRLMSWDDNWTVNGYDTIKERSTIIAPSVQLAMAGNGVVANCSQWIADQIGNLERSVRPYTKSHPCTYSAPLIPVITGALRERSVHGGVLFDVNAGIGKASIIAQRVGMRYRGCELETEWAIQHPNTLVGDSRYLEVVPDGSVDLQMVSPAYANRFADPYAGSPKDRADLRAGRKIKRSSYRLSLGRPLSEGSGAGLAWNDEYRQLHWELWVEAVHKLAIGGLFVLNCKDHQRNLERQYVTWWHGNVLSQLGLEHVWDTEIECAGYRQGANSDARYAEEVLIFRKTA